MKSAKETEETKQRLQGKNYFSITEVWHIGDQFRLRLFSCVAAAYK